VYKFSFLLSKDPEAPEFPKIEFKYHVEFLFMKDDTLAEPIDDTAEIDGKELEDGATRGSQSTY
jgi:hypothetical protein